MKFKVVSVNNTSVRVDIGVVSIDIRVIDGKKIMLPYGVFIPNPQDFRTLAGIVLGEYNKSVSLEEISINDNKNRKAE